MTTDNTGRMVQDGHAANSTGEYIAIDGNKFNVDWTKQRGVRFQRHS